MTTLVLFSNMKERTFISMQAWSKFPKLTESIFCARVRVLHGSYFSEVQGLFPGPLENTVDDFWIMIYQQNCSTVVMLCNCIEMNRDKSWQYWPIEVGHTMVLGKHREGVGLEVTMVHSEDRGHYIIRTFTLTDTISREKRKIKQYHYVDWPDFNVPESPDLFLEFLMEFRKSGCFSESCGPPVGELE